MISQQWTFTIPMPCSAVFCRISPFFLFLSFSMACTVHITQCHAVRLFGWNLFLTIVVWNLTITLNICDEFLSFFQNTLWNHDNFAGPIKITPSDSHQLESKYVDCLCLGRTIITATTATSTTIKRQSHSSTGKTSGKISVHVIDRGAENWKSSQSYSTSENDTVIPKLGVGVFGLMYFKFCENCGTQRKRRVQYSSKFKRWTIVAKTIQYNTTIWQREMQMKSSKTTEPFANKWSKKKSRNHKPWSSPWKVIFQSFLYVDWIIIFNIRIHESHIHSHVRTHAYRATYIYVNIQKPYILYRSSVWYWILKIATYWEKKTCGYWQPHETHNQKV